MATVLAALFLLLAQCLGVVQAVFCPSFPFPPSKNDVAAFVEHSFDILVVGGGTAGVALAARISESSQLSVGLIEAGEFHVGDPIVDIPRYVGRGQQNSNYDWNFVSTSQPHTAGRSFSVARGKMLGGSSGLNGLAWNRASGPEYDVWSQFLLDKNDWTYDTLLPYFKRAEALALHPADPYPGINASEQQQALHDLPRVAGFNGPVQASHNVFYPDVVFSVAETLNKMGVRTNPEPQNGNATGLYNTLASVDRKSGTRSYSASAYLCGGQQKGNLKILTGAQVTRVLFDSAKVPLHAIGVEMFAAGANYTVKAKHEVVLSAGAVQSPQLLELSGIGSSAILKRAGVKVLVDLPGVGENLQEHLYIIVQWELKPGHVTWDILNYNTTFAQEEMSIYNKTRTGLYTDLDSTVFFLPAQDLVDPARLEDLLTLFDADSQFTPNSSIESLQYPIQRSFFEKGDVSITQFAQWSSGFYNPAPNTSYVAILGCVTHPMSRGSIHITSSNGLQQPAIDLGYLSKDFDSALSVDVVKYMLKLGKQEPFASIIAQQTNPAPSMESDDDLLDYVRQTAAGGDHLLGTAAMAARERGGVVDANLVVYGTTNLRIVDASVIPQQISCNPQASIYAMAEKMAVKILKQYT